MNKFQKRRKERRKPTCSIPSHFHCCLGPKLFDGLVFLVLSLNSKGRELWGCHFFELDWRSILGGYSLLLEGCNPLLASRGRLPEDSRLLVEEIFQLLRECSQSRWDYLEIKIATHLWGSSEIRRHICSKICTPWFWKFIYLRNVQVSSLCMVRLIFYRWTLFPTLVCLKLGTILIKVLVQLIV